MVAGRKNMENKEKKRKIKCELYNDSMQGWKCYPIQKAQLIIADVPYNVGNNFYGSNPMWYVGGDNKNGESKFAGKAAFASDYNFNLYEYFHFCSRLMKKDDTKPLSRGRSSNSPCMIVFCSFEQLHTLIDAAKKQGFGKYMPLVFIKNYSPQVLKANMRVGGATEYALLFYRDRLPKFRNGAKLDENGDVVVYANRATIYNGLASIESDDGHKRFIESAMVDPVVKGVIYGAAVKVDANLPDDVAYFGVVGSLKANSFAPLEVFTTIEAKTANRIFTGTEVFDAGLENPKAFVKVNFNPTQSE